MTRGMVLGKFMPPHRGHIYLVDFARHYCDRLTVVVGSLAAKPLPGELRFQWMSQLFPSVQVVHLDDELPQEPAEHADFWAVWETSLRRLLPEPLDYVFASETYGQKLAEVLGARFVPVDIDRSVVPVSGTAVRNNPLACWAWLPECVRAYYVKRVCVFGPESTGKSMLARRLGEHFHTTVVPEYARGLLSYQSGRIEEEDMPVIARGQVASEDALAGRANRVLICDTDALTTAMWSDVLFGAGSNDVRRLATSRRYDLTLLTDVDVPWVADMVRYRPDGRESFLQRCHEALHAAGRRTILISGSWDARFEAASRAVRGLLGEPSLP